MNRFGFLLHGSSAMCAAILSIASPVTLAAQYNITGSSWIGGSGDTDYSVGVRIKSDGNLVVASNLGAENPGGVTPVLLNGATASSGAAVLLVSPDGDSLQSVTRFAGAVFDMGIDASENIYLAAGSDGLVKLSPDASEVLWTADVGGFCRRLDVGPEGTVVALNSNESNAGSGYVYGSDGSLITVFGGLHFTQDVAIRPDLELVYSTGFKNASSGCNPVQVAYLRAHDFTGTEIWRNYDWPGTALETCNGDPVENNMADTRGYRMAIGRDGLLYVGFESAGGNHIFRRDPLDLLVPVPVVAGDMFFNWFDTRAEHKTYVARYDPLTGDYILGQQFCTRFWDGSSSVGNAARMKYGDIAADEQGRVYFGGSTASGIPFNPTHATANQSYTAGPGQYEFNPFPMTPGNNVYSGGAHLVVLSSDLSKRLYTTRLSDGYTHAIDARTLSGKDQPSLAWAGSVEPLNMDWKQTDVKEMVLHTVNPFQAAPAGGELEGFLAVVGQGPAVPFLPQIGTQPTDQSLLEGRTALFSALASGIPLPDYQWQVFSEGSWTDVLGGDKADYRPLVALSDSGSLFRCRISNTEGAVFTDTVTLTVLQDQEGPAIAGVEAVSEIEVRVLFSEKVQAGSGATGAENFSNYQLDNSVSVNSAVLQPDGKTVVLGTSSLMSGTTYTLTVNDLNDLFGNVVTPNTSGSFLFLYEPEIIGVTASISDSNVPSNAIDGDLGSRWSGRGIGEWIQFQLEQPTFVETVKIAFYRGNERQLKFDIQVSMDGVNFTDALVDAVSSGTSLDFEDFRVRTTQGNYVRIIGYGTVGGGKWNSITEVVVLGSLTNDNLDPEITSLTANPSTVTNQSTQLSVVATDPDGDDLQYIWEVSQKPAGAGPVIGTGATPTVTFDKAGSYTFTVTVEDGNGGWDVESTSVTVQSVPSRLGIRAVE